MWANLATERAASIVATSRYSRPDSCTHGSLASPEPLQGFGFFSVVGELGFSTQGLLDPEEEEEGELSCRSFGFWSAVDRNLGAEYGSGVLQSWL